MYLTANKALERYESPDNLANRFERAKAYDSKVRVMPKAQVGFYNHKVNLSVEATETVAILARSGTSTTRAIGAEFGITHENVSHIANNSKVIDHEKVDSIINNIETKTLERLMKSLNLMDDDKMLNLDAKDLSNIAGNLSKVHSNITHKKDSDSGPKVNITIFAPEQRKESHYSTVEV